MAGAANIEFRQLEPGDKCTGLSAGKAVFAPLKTYFQRNAKAHHAASLARTYVAINAAEAKIVGYMTLICSQISTEVPLADADFRYREYPAVKIARLFCDSNVRGLQIGKTLVELAVGIAQEWVAAHVGCRFIVVDSKPESVGFYLKQGFTILDTLDNKRSDSPLMFIDLLRSPKA
jgi:GNAT superfamily N-acetyltransferase